MNNIIVELIKEKSESSEKYVIFKDGKVTIEKVINGVKNEENTNISIASDIEKMLNENESIIKEVYTDTSKQSFKVIFNNNTYYSFDLYLDLCLMIKANQVKKLSVISEYEKNQNKEVESKEINTNNNITKTIKLIEEYDHLTVIEPKIQFDNKNECEIVFEDKMLVELDEDSECIETFNIVMNNKDKVLNSLYNGALEILTNWVEDVEVDMDFVKKNVSVTRINCEDEKVVIEADAWDKDNDESLIGGHILETIIHVDDFDSDEIDTSWNLS